MAYKPRSRTIKPSYFANSQVASMQPLARIAFQGLWSIADREGRLEYRPKEMKLYTVPHDDVNIDVLLEEMIKVGLIVLYVVDNRPFILIPTFKEHQPLHWHEKESQLPEYQEDSLIGSIKALHRVLKGAPYKVRVEVREGVEVKEEVEVRVGRKNEIPYSEIISDLNEVLGTNYREKTEETRQGIRRWWKQGFRLEDFKAVHRIKAAEWQHDPKMRIFLRPKTLYGDKFENYLNQIEEGDKFLDQLSEAGRATYLAGQEVLRARKQRREDTSDSDSVQ